MTLMLKIAEGAFKVFVFWRMCMFKLKKKFSIMQLFRNFNSDQPRHSSSEANPLCRIEGRSSSETRITDGSLKIAEGNFKEPEVDPFYSPPEKRLAVLGGALKKRGKEGNRARMLSLAVLVAVLLPFLVFAQETNQCCRLTRDITLNNLTYAKAALPCSYTPGFTALLKGEVIGAGDCQNNAPEPDVCISKGATTAIDIETQEWGTVCLLDSIYSVTDWIFYFILVIAVFIGIMSAKMFLTSIGKPERLNKAREFLMYMVVGLVIASLSKSIPAFVRVIVGF